MYSPSLDELKDLTVQLRARGLYARMRDFLRGEGLKVGRGWEAFVEEIHGGGTERIAAFNDFLAESILVSFKRVYLLTKPLPKPGELTPPLPPDEPTDYVTTHVPTRGEEPAYYAGVLEAHGVRIHRYITMRPGVQVDEVDKQELPQEVQKKFRGAKLIAKYETNVRCYDFLIELDKKTHVLLVDSPDKLEAGFVARDATTYAMRIREQLGLKPEDSPFIDLFPAIPSIYADDKEGTLNVLEFLSNKGAQVLGKYGSNSKEDYRKALYHQGGKTKAKVRPYRISIRWTTKTDEPLVILPGRAYMAGTPLEEVKPAAQVEPVAPAAAPTQTPGLYYMEIPTNVSWSGFQFALQRVKAHLKPTKA